MNYKTIPKTPGVYLYKNKTGAVIYVGKAGNLRRRVSSYFRASNKDSRINELAREIDDIEIRRTPTVIEAFILEAELIKKYQPKFNVREKDNTSFLYVALTRETWPKPVLIRGKELEELAALTRECPGGHSRVKSKTAKKLNSKFYILDPKKIFGPFVSASSIRAALHILRKIFPYSTCAQASSRVPDQIGDVAIPKVASPRTRAELGTGFHSARQSQRLRRDARNDGRAKPCFNYQIGLCPGVCVGAITKQEYARNIKNLILFFRGKKQQILRDLKKQMRQASKDENFEEAGKLRNQIFALRHIRDTALIGQDRIIDQNHHMSLRVPILERSSVRDLTPRGDLPRAAGGLSSYGRSAAGTTSPLTITRNDADRGINIFGRIEGYDISNISGTSAVGSMVVFQNGEPNKDEYRKFKIKTVKGANDVAMMTEVLRRRFARIMNHELGIKDENRLPNSLFLIPNSWQKPDLIVIDGGLGQVNVTREVLRAYNLNIPIIGIAKGFMRKQDRPVVSATSEIEKFELQRIVENYKDLILRVRDESHRFAIQYHRKLRAKKALQ